MKQLISIIFAICLISCASSNVQQNIPVKLAEHFTKDVFQRVKFGGINSLKIHAENIDINDDGILDWYLENPKSCKDIIFGCHGYIYLNIDNAFCYAGTFFKNSGLKRKSKIECIYKI